MLCSVHKYSLGTSVWFEIRLFQLKQTSLWTIPFGTGDGSLKLCLFLSSLQPIPLQRASLWKVAKKAFGQAPLGPSYFLRIGWYFRLVSSCGATVGLSDMRCLPSGPGTDPWSISIYRDGKVTWLRVWQLRRTDLSAVTFLIVRLMAITGFFINFCQN